MSAVVNKRDVMLELLNKKSPQEYIPAAFFIHFEESFRLGPAASGKTSRIFPLYRHGFCEDSI